MADLAPDGRGGPRKPCAKMMALLRVLHRVYLRGAEADAVDPELQEKRETAAAREALAAAVQAVAGAADDDRIFAALQL